jgi:RecA-family ATPase
MTDLDAIAREYQDADAQSSPRTLIVGSMDHVQPEEVRWLWPGRIPLGKLTMLDGDPGLGKSLVTLDLASRVSTGAPMPGTTERSKPAPVVILTAEDGLGDTVRPRLDGLRANVSMIHAVIGVKLESGGEQGVTFPVDLEALQATVLKLQAKLVIIDPFMAFISDGVNTRIDHDVRRLLAPLARLAEATRAAVVVIRHLNKASMGSALYRGGGSIAFIGAARAGLLIARDPEDEQRRVLATTKMNLAPEPPSLAFTIENASGAPCIRWLGETYHKANDLVSASADEDGRQEAQDLRAFVREMVETAPRTHKEAVAAIRAAGFDAAERTIRRARKAAGVHVKRQGFGPGSVVVWALGNGHSGHIPAMEDTPGNVASMTTMGRCDDPDAVARDAMREGA